MTLIFHCKQAEAKSEISIYLQWIYVRVALYDFFYIDQIVNMKEI